MSENPKNHKNGLKSTGKSIRPSFLVEPHQRKNFPREENKILKIVDFLVDQNGKIGKKLAKFWGGGIFR